MYCKYCGSVLPMGSRFCPNCSNEVEDGYLRQVLNKNDVANYVGKHEAYFFREFSNVAAGQKGSFNWGAFWFGPFYCVYRKQYDILWKYYKVPLGAFFICFFGVTMQLMDGNMDIEALTKGMMIWVGLSFVATLWWYVAQVRLGRNFNRLYFESWKKKIAEKKSLKEYGGTSVKSVVLLSFLISLVSSLPVVAIVLVLMAQPMGSSYEYGITQEETDENEVVYGYNSYNSGIEIDEADENEVVYGYNTYNPGIEVDEAIQNAIIGEYDLGDGITISISMDDDLRMTMYADGQQQSWFHLSVWNVQGNTVIFQGYLGDEIWEAMDINSMEDAEVQMEVVISGGKVTNIFENGTDIWFQKL
ncbi:MAG TPA: hypothetical protein DIC60_05730 [Lachnospiraceae bacterium]|nr:hypothetical protein [Lachnospiraceae bacterium]